MGLRNLRNRIRDTRSGDTTHPLGLEQQARQKAFVAGAFGPEPEDTDPAGADLTDPAAIPPGAHRSTQTKYGDGVSRCGVLGCGTNTTGLVCSVCLAAGRLPPDVDGYLPPFMERILPDPPLHLPPRSGFGCGGRDDLPLLDGAGYVLEPLPDVADFEEARDRLRTEVIGRIGGAA